MLAHASRPVIMPMSNPTELSEADPADILAWTVGRAFVGSGSPCPPVEIDGRTVQIGQGNNAFIFPAVGLAALVTKSRRIDHTWLTAAAEAVADTVTQPETRSGLIYPDIARLPEVLSEVAAALVVHATGMPVDQARNEVARAAWHPVYPEFE
jgi:malate dehydrogenase (oxaloacetate-decarboxylating)